MAVEPAWHRRARRLRSGHRLLAQVSAACVKLAGHHGSSPPELLRPLLYALSKYAPRPCDVPWPDALLSKGSHRSPKTMIMPYNVIPEVAVDPAVASSSCSLVSTLSYDVAPPIDISGVVVASVVASSPSTLTGDFRSLPGDYWRTISFPSTLVTYSISLCASEFRMLILRDRARYLQSRSCLRRGPPDHPLMLRVTTCYDNCIELCRNTLSQLPAMMTAEQFSVLKRAGETHYVCLAPLQIELEVAIQALTIFLDA
jgi:hypothetical protein